MSVELAGVSQIVGGLLGGGVLVTAINAWVNRRKVSADADSVSVATANSLLVVMRADITELRARVAHQDQALAAYGRRVDYLTGLLLRSGVDVKDWSSPL